MSKIGRDMGNESLLTDYCYFGSFLCYEQRRNNGGLMEIEPVLLWPYLSQFIKRLTTSAHLGYSMILKKYVL